MLWNQLQLLDPVSERNCLFATVRFISGDVVKCLLCDAESSAH